jgi:hypothetical protein
MAGAGNGTVTVARDGVAPVEDGAVVAAKDG